MSQEKKSFKGTLNLPKTDFPIRYNPELEDAQILKRWEEEHLFVKSFELNAGNESFILHDGPPYANGPIHLGHAYNKILKDFVGKSQRMQKKHVPITPGWDCHGLPIELKVTQELEGKEVTSEDFIKACRDYAQKWIDIQRNQFKKLGVLMDWPDPYLTMNFGYEASTLQAFGFFVEKGFIERKNKTVAWCASCQTVLANAEIEYQERKDPSVYVKFPLEQRVVDVLVPELVDKQVSLLIWTTTPWTLPLNRAVLIKPDTDYVVLDIKGQLVMVGKDLAQALCKKFEVPCKTVASVNADQILAQNPKVQHPFIPHLHAPLISSETVDVQEGTAFVHCAPGCGPEDYEIGVKHGLEIFSPISSDGTYTKGVQPIDLEGMSVKDGQIWVIKKTAQDDSLLFKTSIRHSYPHCWRCRQGLIFRATKQWFCDLAKHNLKERTLHAIGTIKTYPEKAANRLMATLQGRLEWCLSRQRLWGIPIPALMCTGCDEAYTSKAFVDTVAQGVAQEGVEYWNRVAVDEIVPKDLNCSACGATSFKKETDILDVWFDSGISHYAVLCKRAALSFPADMYLEGKDQHRGWFQSSLLTSMVIEGEPAMRSVLTHGFTVDDAGRKMSKSLGNVISPDQMIKQLGTDGLRLWVASIDYTDDAVVSPVLLKNVKEVFRKVRNSCRFLLSNIYDFTIETDAVSLDQLYSIDQYALQQIHNFNLDTIESYNNYDFTAVFHALADYCTVDLSSFYLDSIKDRLYVEDPSGIARRSAQTVCWYILDTLAHLIAPILSFTAEQVSDHYQKDKRESIHLQPFASPPDVDALVFKRRDTQDPFKDVLVAHSIKTPEAARSIETMRRASVWETLQDIRSALLKSIEQLREKGIIKHPLEARLIIHLDSAEQDIQQVITFLQQLNHQTPEQFLKEFMIVSDVVLSKDKKNLDTTDVGGLFVNVEQAGGKKCPRCWHWHVSDHPDDLCSRCQKVLQ